MPLTLVISQHTARIAPWVEMTRLFNLSHFEHFVISNAVVRSLLRLLFHLTIPPLKPESLLVSWWQGRLNLCHLECSAEISITVAFPPCYSSAQARIALWVEMTRSIDLCHLVHFVISNAVVRSLLRLHFHLRSPPLTTRSLLGSRWQSLFNPTILIPLSSRTQWWDLYYVCFSTLRSSLTARIALGVEMTKLRKTKFKRLARCVRDSSGNPFLLTCNGVEG